MPLVLTKERTSVTYGEQTAFRTVAASCPRWMGVVKNVDGLFPEVDVKEIRAAGAGRDALGYYAGARKVEGSIKLNPQWLSNRILKYFFDKLTDAGAGDPYTHTLEGYTGTNAYDLTPITLRRGYAISATNEIELLTRDCILDSLEIGFAEEDLVEITLGVKGGKVSHSASVAIAAPTKDTTAVYGFKDMAGSFTLNGVSQARIKSFHFKAENGGSTHIYGSSTDPDWTYEYVPGSRKYTLDCELLPVDDTFLAYIDAASPATTAAFDIKFTGQTGPPERSLEIKGNVTGSGMIKTAPHNLPDEGEITVPINALLSNAQIIVKDNVSTYGGTP